MDGTLCPYDLQMGFGWIEADDDHVTLEAHVDSSLHNPEGVLHGGVLAGLLDSAMGHLMVRRLREGEQATNVDLNVKFLRATVAGTLTARSRMVKDGRTTCLIEASAHDVEGRLVARAEATFLRLRR